MRTILSADTEPAIQFNKLVSHRWRISVWAQAALVSGVLFVFIALSAWYSITVPAFETPDEIHHYAFARHLSMGHELPVQTVGRTGPWEHEGTQAPLYYVLLGRLISGIDQSDFEQVDRLNPHANLGNPLYPGNKNRMLYSSLERPLQGTTLAMHVGRWFSIFLASLTLILVYLIARLAFPHSRLLPLLVLGTVAAIPQFQFISATVSNDNVVILTSTAIVYWLARLVSRPLDAPIRGYELGVLGVLLGLAALSKLQGLGLIPLSALTILGLAWMRRDLKLPIRSLVLVLVPLLLVAGWWYWRNYTLYGEWLGVNQLLTINGLRESSRTLAELWGELRGVRYSFWGLFGWFSILMPQAVYALLDWITPFLTVGTIVYLAMTWRQGSQRPLERPSVRVHLLLLTWAVMLLGLMLYWLSFATSGQGRLLFPAIAAFGVFMVMGLSVWLRPLPATWQLPAFLVLPATLLLASLYSLLVILPQSYQPQEPVQRIPEGAVEHRLIFDDRIELLAVDVPDGRFEPGDEIDITLYLRALESFDEDYPLFLQLIGPDNMVIGNITSHPGWGRNPTSLWQPGAIYPDRYTLTVWDSIDNRSPLLARLYVGFLDPVTRAPVSITTEEGGSVPRAFVASVDMVSAQPLDPDVLDLQASDARFAKFLRLAGYNYPELIQPGNASALTVTLLWETLDNPPDDYTAFVHLLNGDGEQVSGYDQPPAEGRYPTSHWQAGDRSLSQFRLPIEADIPPGTYHLWVGLYSDEAGMERLPVESGGRTIQDQRVYLGSIDVY